MQTKLEEIQTTTQLEVYLRHRVVSPSYSSYRDRVLPVYTESYTTTHPGFSFIIKA